MLLYDQALMALVAPKVVAAVPAEGGGNPGQGGSHGLGGQGVGGASGGAAGGASGGLPQER